VNEIEARERLLFHTGTAEIPARVRLLTAAPRRLIEILLNEPVLAIPGDRFVLRRPSPSETIGGGLILDIFPPRRLNRAKAAARLSKLAESDLSARLAILVDEKENGRSLDELVRLTGQPAANIQNELAHAGDLVLVETARRVVSRRRLECIRGSILNALAEYHKRHPAEESAPLSAFRFGVENALVAFALRGLREVRISGDKIALASFRPQLTNQQAAELARIEQQFRAAGYQPPSPAEFPRAVLERLIKAGKLVRISNDLVFHADVIAHIRTSLAAQKGRRFSVPEFKQWMQISRKYAIPLLEFLDHQHITRREGDMRVVL
jgi:selenocysteine-specific elongation factor